MSFPRQCSVCKTIVMSRLKTVMCCDQPMGSVDIWRDPLVVEAMQKMLDRHSEGGHPIIDNLNDRDYLAGVFFWLATTAHQRGAQNERP